MLDRPKDNYFLSLRSSVYLLHPSFSWHEIPLPDSSFRKGLCGEVKNLIELGSSDWTLESRNIKDRSPALCNYMPVHEPSLSLFLGSKRLNALPFPTIITMGKEIRNNESVLEPRNELPIIWKPAINSYLLSLGRNIFKHFLSNGHFLFLDLWRFLPFLLLIDFLIRERF